MKVFIAALIAAGICLPWVPAHAQEGRRAVLVIPAKDFQDDEFAKPKALLERDGIEVVVASTTTDEVTGMNGAKVTPGMLLEDVKAEDFDAVVFIGGSGAMQYLADETAFELARSSVSQEKLTGAICLAPLILANAGLLEGKKATCYPDVAGKLKEKGAEYTGAGVQTDGKIITANGPAAAEMFGQTLVSALFVPPEASKE